jgi:FkbM family methyltransferase
MFATAQLNLGLSAPSRIAVHPRFLKYPVTLRAKSSDPFIFRQIMIENEYEPLTSLSVSAILDLGANAGFSSAYLLSKFDTARLFAVEAEHSNFKACQKNLAPYQDRVRVIHAAVWSRRAPLTIQSNSCEANFWVKEAEASDTSNVGVMGWDVASLIDLSGFDQVDLLKIDVEGAEEKVFAEGFDTWLPRVKNICIELHGAHCRNTFFSALQGYDYQHLQHGELDICLNLVRRAPEPQPIEQKFVYGQ